MCSSYLWCIYINILKGIDDYLDTVKSNSGSISLFNILLSLYSALLFINVNQRQDNEDIFDTFSPVKYVIVLDYPLRSLVLFNHLIATSKWNEKTYLGYLVLYFNFIG